MLKHNIDHILVKKSCLYFDKKYKCVSFIVHYKGLTLKTGIQGTHIADGKDPQQSLLSNSNC